MASYSDVVHELKNGRGIYRQIWMPGIHVYMDDRFGLARIGKGDPNTDDLFAPLEDDKWAVDWEVCELAGGSSGSQTEPP